MQLFYYNRYVKAFEKLHDFNFNLLTKLTDRHSDRKEHF